MFRYLTTVKPANSEYWKVMATASTTLISVQSAATSIQSENRQSSRKRKQNMPSSAAHNSITVTPVLAAHVGHVITSSSVAHNGLPVASSSTAHNNLSVTSSSAVVSSSAAPNGLTVTSSSVSHNGFSRTPSSVGNQASHGIIPQANAKNLKASISAVVSFNIPEHIVKQCAEDMLKQGKLLTATTLLQECESCYSPDGEQSCSYSERASSNSDNDDLYNSFIGATSLPAELNEGPLAQSATADYGLIPGVSHTASSAHTNGETHGESRSDSTDSMVANQTSDPPVPAQSTEQHEDNEDVVDGYLPTLGRGAGIGLNECIEADNADSSTEVSRNITSQISSPGLLNTSSSTHHGLHNGLSRPGQQECYDGSGISSNNSSSVCSFTHSSSSGLEHSEVSSTNSMGQAAAQVRRGSMASAKHSPKNVTEHMSTCFKLIEREHELLEKSRKCSQCFEKPREVTFLPCGHFTVCRLCADPLYVCPSCNKSILATVNTYLS